MIQQHTFSVYENQKYIFVILFIKFELTNQLCLYKSMLLERLKETFQVGLQGLRSIDKGFHDEYANANVINQAFQYGNIVERNYFKVHIQ